MDRGGAVRLICLSFRSCRTAALVTTETRNRLEPSCPANAADEFAARKGSESYFFQQGFFKVREASLNFIRRAGHRAFALLAWLLPPARKLFVVPGDRTRCAAIERRQGIHIFEQWLAAVK